MGAEVLTVKISSVQAVALAFVTYFIGLWIKNRVPVFQKLSLPAAVIGGLPFAFILSGLRVYGILQVDFDNTLSTVALLVFFTTIGMMASLKLIKYGGLALILYLIVSSILGFVQNLLGCPLPVPWALTSTTASWPVLFPSWVVSVPRQPSVHILKPLTVFRVPQPLPSQQQPSGW